MKLRALMTIALLFVTSAHAQTRDTPRAAIDRFLAAVNHLSVDEMTPLFTTDATVFFPIARFGSRLTGRDAIMTAFAAMFTQEKQRIASQHGAAKGKAKVVSAGMMTARDIYLQPIGKDTVVASFDVGTGNLFSRRTAVLVLRGGRWQILHMHASNLRQ